MVLHDLSQCTANQLHEQLRFIEAEARKGTKSIGFVPRSGLEYAARRGRLVTLSRNDDLVGFVLYGGRGSSARIYQIWVRADARLLLHGKQLTNWVGRWGMYRGRIRVSLWCLRELPATEFWRAMGFQKGGVRCQSIDTRRHQTRWVREISYAWPEPLRAAISPPPECVGSNQPPAHHPTAAADQPTPLRQTTLYPSV